MTTLYGYAPAQWDEMVEAGLAYLADVAGRQATTSYSEICAQIFDRAGVRVGPRDAALGGLLADVARRSRETKGVILPAVLLSAELGQPGAGFFSYAAEVGLLPKKAKADDKLMFWAGHLKRVYEVYAAK